MGSEGTGKPSWQEADELTKWRVARPSGAPESRELFGLRSGLELATDGPERVPNNRHVGQNPAVQIGIPEGAVGVKRVLTERAIFIPAEGREQPV